MPEPNSQPLMGAAEIARYFGVSPGRVHQMATEAGFPEPYAVLSKGKVWRTEDIEEWVRRTGRKLASDTGRA